MQISTRKPYEILKWLFLVLPTIWLIWSAIILEVEYYDGFDAIASTYFLLGESPVYINNNTVLPALFLVPSRLLSQWFSLNPLNLIFYHFQTALLHTFYLFATYYFIEKKFGKIYSVPLAFAAAILSFMFFSYGAFLNIDIFPGLMFLVMIFFTVSFTNDPKLFKWLVLVIVGAAAALIKQPFGVFWAIIIIVSALQLIKNKGNKTQFSDCIPFLLLCLGAFVAFCLYWLAMSLTLSKNFPDIPFLLLPWMQINNSIAGAPGIVKPWWIYLRNAPYYGISVMILVVPGLVMALKNKDRLQNFIGISWILSFIAFQILPLREVRYIAFLAPLSAFIIVPPLKIILNRKSYTYIFLIVFSFDLIRASYEAVRFVDPFYSNSQLKSFLAVVSYGKIEEEYIVNHFLTFMPPLHSPLAGDHYHRKFHFGPHHLKVFSNLISKIKWIEENKNLKENLTYEKKSYLLYSTLMPINSNDFISGIPHHLNEFATFGTVVEVIPFEIKTFTKAFKNGVKEQIIIENKELGKTIEEYIFPCLYNKLTGRFFPVIQLSKSKFLIQLPKGIELGKFTDYELRGYKILVYVYANVNGGTELNIIDSGQ